MKRNFFILKAVLLAFLGTFFPAPSPSEAATHKGTVTFTVELAGAEKSQNTRLWLPYPLSDAFQTISDVDIQGNQESLGIYNDPQSGALYLAAGWTEPKNTPALIFRFDIASHYKKLEELRETEAPYPLEVLRFLKTSESIPADDPFFRDLAEKLKIEKSVLKRARLVYDWVVENTFRNPDVKGCGLGLPIRTLNEMKGGGKCADISAVFVTLARAAGIPARDVYGLRMASPKTGEITADFHCWAEFYLPGTGWVPVDPADVRKAMLVEKLELKDADKWREFFWGGDDLFRIALNRDTRETVLSDTTKSSPLTYFMYPYAEVNGVAKNFFNPQNFKYSVMLELK